MAYERIGDQVAPHWVFVFRLVRNLVLALGLITGSLAVGMWGYHTYESKPWIDAFAEAAMILSGMGPLSAPNTDAGKLFAGSYAIYSGLFLVATAGIILAPVLHRLLHHMHAADEDENP